MKEWTEEDRGGSGTDEQGRVRCRDRYAYQRLRKVFSKQFMVDHWYVLHRNRRSPMEMVQRKACKTCGIEKRNDFGEFPKEPWGLAGKYTTADVCKVCMSKAVAVGRQRAIEEEQVRRTAYEEFGSEMWERK